MKRLIVSITIVLLLGTISWGQGAKEPFDTAKSKAELEIMKGIFNTTLKYFAQNSQDKMRWRLSGMRAFYLAGQGAVFEIPTSGLRSPGISGLDFDFGPEFQEQMAAMSEEIRANARELAREAARMARDRAKLDRSGTPAPAAAPAPLNPPAPPAPEIDRTKLKKSVEDAQARTKKLREEAEANREKFLKSLAESKVYLIEALANYGDGMTTVKPEEYINLVLTSSADDDQKTRSDIISARRSWISDYKAGRLTLDAFKQKVVQYNQ